MNRLFVAKHAGRIVIYDYRDSKLLLHSKMLMIDGRFSLSSSVNLNNRSFIHDNENGIAVLDPAFYAQMKVIFEAYKRAAVPVDGGEVGLGWRLLLSWPLLREAL
ncbi:phospholipase D-like domain-containing protein [bacterium]|nr:phospholipase D-like domain-containing protein [bacterium]